MHQILVLCILNAILYYLITDPAIFGARFVSVSLFNNYLFNFERLTMNNFMVLPGMGK